MLGNNAKLLSNMNSTNVASEESRSMVSESSAARKSSFQEEPQKQKRRFMQREEDDEDEMDESESEPERVIAPAEPIRRPPVPERQRTKPVSSFL